MTLKDMGKALGVSPSTISKVLNGCNKNFTIPDELRGRIWKHVEECGYSPNPVFRSMRVSNNKQIACFFYSRSSLKTGNTIDVSVDAAIIHLEKINYEVYYQFCTQARLSGYPQPNWKVAGILIPDAVSPDQLTALEKKNQLYVSINGICGPKGTAVQADELLNMKLATEYLYETGHRNIAYIYPRQNEMQEPHYASKERLSGYMRFVQSHDLQPFDINATYDNTDWIAQALSGKLSAVITGNETLGTILFRAAYDNGIKIPDDISLIVFNDPDYLSNMVPAFSALRLPAKEMGTLAGKIMEKRIMDFACDLGKVYRLPGELMLRESTAPLKK